MSRRRPSARPARPAPECEVCGADVWWAWSLAGKCWTALAPRRLPLEGDFGTYEVWRDAHGGLLCMYLPPGERGDQDSSWRGVHHNAMCGAWRSTVTTALIGEVRGALAVMPDHQLLVLGDQLRALGVSISGEIRRRVLAAGD